VFNEPTKRPVVEHWTHHPEVEGSNQCDQKIENKSPNFWECSPNCRQSLKQVQVCFETAYLGANFLNAQVKVAK